MMYGPEECHERFCRLFVDHDGEHFPRRVQLSRRKGWRKPENTVVVARPSRWGNPFPADVYPFTRADAVRMANPGRGPDGARWAQPRLLVPPRPALPRRRPT